MIYVLDTDHMTILERGGAEAMTLDLRLSALPPESVATTVITYDEQLRGWLAEISRARSIKYVVLGYARLEANLSLYRNARLLSFDDRAATEFLQLRRSGVRVGTMDLRIAAIALTHGATILTRNTADFGRVPGLRVEDWTG